MKKAIVLYIVAAISWILAKPTIEVSGTMANTIYTQSDAIFSWLMYITLILGVIFTVIYLKQNKSNKSNI